MLSFTILKYAICIFYKLIIGNKIMSKPILKWAGGKTQLLNQIENFLPKAFTDKVVQRYAVPFVGGGALFFYLQDKFKIKETYISDTNKDLILLY